LRDEMIAWNKKNVDALPVVAAGDGGQSENRDRYVIIALVTKSVTVITQRLTSLSTFDGVESKVGTLVAAANSVDNLCRMDPAWHPWL
jgi:transformation/transcription domain-associated protein